MKFCTVVGLFAFSVAAAASSPRFDVKTELSINGKVVPKDRIRMKVSTPADDSYRHDEVLFDLDLVFHAGNRIVHSTPQVFAKPGHVAVMTLEESAKGEKIQLKLWATPR